MQGGDSFSLGFVVDVGAEAKVVQPFGSRVPYNLGRDP